MTDNTTAIRKAYIDPICSVMLVDEAFPSYGDVAEEVKSSETKAAKTPPLNAFKEAETALQLWRACHKRGWVCDVKNSSFEDIEDLKKADLVVLDYLLDGYTSDLATKLLGKLAEAEKARLVILYTNEDDLNGVRRKVAACLRGVCDISSLHANLEKEIENLEERLQDIDLGLSGEDVDDWLRGRERAVCKRIEKRIPQDLRSSTRELIMYFLEYEISRQGTTARSEIIDVNLSNSPDSQWVFCRNLFVAIVFKGDHSSDAVFDALEKALQDWKPTPIHLSLAYARTEITRRGFEVERAVPREPALEAGLTYFALKEGPKRGTRVLFEKIWEVLGRDIGDVIGEFGGALLQTGDENNLTRAKDICGIEGVNDDKIFEHLNAFLCSESPPTKYLRTGTILERPEDSEAVWICVTPECDLEPGRPRAESWKSRTGPFSPILFFRAEINTSSKAVHKKENTKNDEESRHVLWVQEDSIRCASVSTVRTETMLAANDGRIEGGCVRLQRVFADGEALNVGKESFHVIGQLRDQYASSLLQHVGDHASRIGLDFEKLPKS